MTQQNDNLNRLIQEAREQIEQQQYLLAINNLNYIIENSDRNGYTFFLRGKAYSGEKKYQSALIDYQTALDIYRETDNKKFQIYTLIELSFVYPFNGKVREGFLAQQEAIKIAKEIDISEDDPLYPQVSSMSKISNESLNIMESTLQNMGAIPSWDKFGLMGRMMGYATKGKLQSYLFIGVWLVMAIPALILAILSAPFWLPGMIQQIKQIKRKNNE
ncbi:MAG: hypothetical protein QNJ60_07160 [Xenococcaceae cyanobacterium MO_188.B19]|nr:hypothetical protein [Xenococcaceae cyanobacterium MO_188.B19]